MKSQICFCPKSILWIGRHLKMSARATFRKMLKGGVDDLILPRRGKPFRKLTVRRKKRRTAKQRAATRKLLAFNRKRRRGRR